MGYPESFNELERWWDTLRLVSDGDAVIHAIEDRIGSESDPKQRQILLRFLYQEYVAQGRQEAADAIRGFDPSEQIHRWYNGWRRNAPEVDITPALDERIRHETDALKLHELRFLLASAHTERGNFAAAEATYLADIAANPDDPLLLIFLAELKLYNEQTPETALPFIERAVEVSMRTGVFRRHALATKARIALEVKAYELVEDVMRRIMQLTFTRGNMDIGTERDILDRLPPGSIDAEVARDYEEYCVARGKTRTSQQIYVDGLVLWFAKPGWLKVARIIAEVLREAERNGVETSADAVADSIRLMVDQGRLEAQGNLSKWRYSEVKLPDADMPKAETGSPSPEEEVPAERESTVIVASRTLTMLVDGSEVEVPVTIYAPTDKMDHWRCEFEIGWPDKTKVGRGYGLDAVQALLIALQTIGIQLYTSAAHKQGKLKLDEPHGGYGFPPNAAMRELYEGLDRFL